MVLVFWFRVLWFASDVCGVYGLLFCVGWVVTIQNCGYGCLALGWREVLSCMVVRFLISWIMVWVCWLCCVWVVVGYGRCLASGILCLWVGLVVDCLGSVGCMI